MDSYLQFRDKRVFCMFPMRFHFLWRSLDMTVHRGVSYTIAIDYLEITLTILGSISIFASETFLLPQKLTYFSILLLQLLKVIFFYLMDRISLNSNPKSKTTYVYMLYRWVCFVSIGIYLSSHQFFVEEKTGHFVWIIPLFIGLSLFEGYLNYNLVCYYIQANLGFYLSVADRERIRRI